MWRLVFIQLLFSMSAYADQFWTIEGALLEFKSDSKSDLIISKRSCNQDCMALRAYRSQIKIKENQLNLRGGKNPGAVLCKAIHHGAVLIGSDEEGNKNSFCKFSDQSFIATSSLLSSYLESRKKN